MITIDRRIGSGELLPLFPPCSARIGDLEFGDFAFIGNGETEDAPLTIGIERKKVHDLVNCMVSGRLSGHQLIGMQNTYNVIYLIVEGYWKTEKDTGLLMLWNKVLRLGSRTFMTRDIIAFLQTLEIITGIHVWWTVSPQDTVTYVTALHYWWGNKLLSEHKSHLNPYIGGNHVDLVKQPLVRRWAAQLDGVGWGKSQYVSQYFGSAKTMANADEKEWGKIKGIGKKLSKRIIEQIEEEV